MLRPKVPTQTIPSDFKMVLTMAYYRNFPSRWCGHSVGEDLTSFATNVAVLSLNLQTGSVVPCLSLHK
jgi:hypothetical protein